MYGGRYAATKEEDSTVYEYTMNVLSEHNIQLDCEVPEEIGYMRALVVSYGEYDKAKVKSVMSQTQVLSAAKRDTEDYTQAADSFIKKCGYLDENTKMVSVSGTDSNKVVTYKNYYEEVPLEVCYMIVNFTDGKITGFDRKWMEVEEEGPSKREVMSPLSALLYFMGHTDSSQRVIIEDIYMTYWIDSYDPSGNVLYDTALPAWCIKYNNGQTQYISAIMQ